jgi:putative transposase
MLASIFENVKHFLADLAKVYKAVLLQAADAVLQNLLERWQEQYPFAVKPWVDHWEHIIPDFKYPAPLRRVMYTTNTV